MPSRPIVADWLQRILIRALLGQKEGLDGTIQAHSGKHTPLRFSVQMEHLDNKMAAHAKLARKWHLTTKRRYHSSTKGQRNVANFQLHASFSCPFKVHVFESLLETHHSYIDRGLVNIILFQKTLKVNDCGGEGRNSPASPTLKLRDLNGSEPPCPCLGGAPG